jgi:hypothetical protein
MKKGQVKKCLLNNNGSAIITVVITMLFVVALGTTLLYAAYTSLQVSASTYKEKRGFYDASAVMEDVKAKIQDQVSKALQTAYTETLISYAKFDMKDISGATTSDPQKALYAAFLRQLKDQTIFDYSYDASSEKTTITVNITALKPSSSAGDDIHLVGESNAICNGDESFTIKNLELDYYDKGFKSRISTDIVIQIPSFFTGTSATNGVSRYAIIAEKGLVANGVSSAVENGGVFAGDLGITTSGVGDQLIISGGKVVTAGNVSAVAGSKLNIGPVGDDSEGYDIWAKEVVAEKSSLLALKGNAYVADDLILNTGSNVTLSGQYYGFGSNDALKGSDNSNSSSIYVNSFDNESKNASLNLTGLTQLSIAGISFISPKNGPSIATGQSVMAKSDQFAYLVPASVLENYKTNPSPAQKEKDNIYTRPRLKLNFPLWTVGGVDKNIADYLGIDLSDPDAVAAATPENGYAGKNGSIVPYFTPDGVGYFFINFTNQAVANEYFKDYFTARPDSIKQYLDLYLNITGGNSTVTVTKGNIYKKTSTTWENILGNSYFPDTQASYLAQMYNNLSKSPIYQYVNPKKYADLTRQMTFTDGSGKTVAIVTNEEEYTYSGGDVKVIIAKGNVKIFNANFNGLIISGGVVTLNNHSVTYEEPTEEILSAKCGKVLLSDYLNTAIFTDEETEKVNEWAPDKLVYYSNWQKNPTEPTGEEERT